MNQTLANINNFHATSRSSTSRTRTNVSSPSCIIIIFFGLLHYFCVKSLAFTTIPSISLPLYHHMILQRTTRTKFFIPSLSIYPRDEENDCNNAQTQDYSENHKLLSPCVGRRRVLFGMTTFMLSSTFAFTIPSNYCTANAVEINTSFEQQEQQQQQQQQEVQVPHQQQHTQKSSISSSNKPYASNKEALLPAVRVKLTIDNAIGIINDFRSKNTAITNIEDYYLTLQKLGYLLLVPQNYTKSLRLQGIPNQPAKQYLESYKPMSGDLPLQLYLIKFGDVNTWKGLKRKEKNQEKNDEILAAFNAYTDLLTFSGDSYLLNVDSKQRSEMIRQDKLPELKQVIASDMDLRYLYRNQVLTAMDDSKAELSYQISLLSSKINNNGDNNGSENDLNLSELFNLLRQAQTACEKWFDLIDDNEVTEAMQAVQNERQ